MDRPIRRTWIWPDWKSWYALVLPIPSSAQTWVGLRRSGRRLSLGEFSFISVRGAAPTKKAPDGECRGRPWCWCGLGSWGALAPCGRFAWADGPGLREVLVLLLPREGEALNLVPMDADRAPDPAGPEFVGAQELEELRPADPEFFADFGDLQEKGTSRSGFRLVHGDWLPANKKAPVGFEPKRAFCLGGLGSVGGKASLGRRHSCRCQTARGKKTNAPVHQTRAFTAPDAVSPTAKT